MLASVDQRPADGPGHDNHSGHTNEQGDAAAATSFFFSGVEKHDHKDEEHHDRAGVNNHLDGGHKLRAQQQVDQRQRHHHHHQRKSAVDRVALYEQVDRPCHTDQAEDDEQYLVDHSLSSPGHDETGDNDVGDRQRQQELPAEGHELVIAETGQRAADPYIQKDKKEDLGRKIKYRQQRLGDVR